MVVQKSAKQQWEMWQQHCLCTALKKYTLLLTDILKEKQFWQSFDREWIVKVTLNRGFHVRSRCLNVSGTLDFFWSTFCCCDDWLGCFWARKSQNIRVLWWEIQNKKNLCHELLQKEQTCIAPIGRMFENRQVVWTWSESPKTTFVHNDTIYASSQQKSWSLVLSHGENNLLHYNVVNVHI